MRTQRSFTSGAHGWTPSRSACSMSHEWSSCAACPLTTTLKASVIGVAVDLERDALVDRELEELRARRGAEHDRAVVDLVVHGEDVDVPRCGHRDAPERRGRDALPALLLAERAGRRAVGGCVRHGGLPLCRGLAGWRTSPFRCPLSHRARARAPANRAPA